MLLSDVLDENRGLRKIGTESRTYSLGEILLKNALYYFSYITRNARARSTRRTGEPLAGLENISSCMEVFF